MPAVITIAVRYMAAAFLVAGVSPLVACTEQPDSLSSVPQGVREKIAAADRNEDGRITRDEIRDWDELLEARFETADGDENGALDPEEFDDLLTYRRAARQ